MPVPKIVHNAFTAKEVHEISGLSLPMINYLRRMDFLSPAYSEGAGRRGKVRYYSYRDLVIAKLIQQLRASGVELSTLKEAAHQLREDALWAETSDAIPQSLRWLKTDGKDVFIARKDGFLEHMRADKQGAFGFLVNVGELVAEIRDLIPPGQKRDNFSMQNRRLILSEKAAG